MIFERIWDGPALVADFVNGAGEDLVLAFASVGGDPARLPAQEFVATALGGKAGRRALFVSDAGRSWGNDPDFAPMLRETVARIAARRPLRRIAAIGLSMGAFSALVAAQIVPVDVTLAFSPQWSVVPGGVPEERRWAEWTKRLPPIRWPVAPVPAHGWTCIFHGMQDDLAHASRFPCAPGLDHILFPEFGHADLVPHLKARGVLGGLMEAALVEDRRRLLRIVSSAGGGLRRRLLPP